MRNSLSYATYGLFPRLFLNRATIVTVKATLTLKMFKIVMLRTLSHKGQGFKQLFIFTYNYCSARVTAKWIKDERSTKIN